MVDFIFPTDLFARGGGGGSGGGGGGGGGSIFALWGYGIAYVCQWLMKLPRPLNYVFTWTFSIAITIASLWLPFGWAFAIAAAIGAYCGATGRLNSMHKFLKNKFKATKQLKAAAMSDSQWHWETIQPQLEQIFYQFQNDWAAVNLANIQTYTTPDYFTRTHLLLYALQQMRRQNKMSNVKILQIVPVGMVDNENDQLDTLTVAFQAKATDELWEDQERLYVDNSTFIEEWVFRRNPTDTAWILSSIEQSTRTPYLELGDLATFAAQNSFYYSGDFGWLLLPRRGQIFSKANFKKSDINSHVVGMFRNLLVQFYVYIPNKQQTNTRYVIAQAALPKTYGNIVVRKKKFWPQGGTKGLTKVSMEWGDFNKKYEVYASDMERVTSFELLHPVFMEKMEALPFDLSIEVVDNVVYLYTLDRKASYDKMMSILKDSFDEMRL